MSDILCVPKMSDVDYLGINIYAKLDVMYNALDKYAVKVDRDVAEASNLYKQVCTYVTIYTLDPNGKPIFLAGQRKSGAKDTRLHGGYKLAFGGHVEWDENKKPHEMVNDTVLIELGEELNLPNLQYEGNKFEFIGQLDTDIDEIGMQHLGFYFTYEITDSDVVEQMKTLEPEKMRLLWIPQAFIGMLDDKYETWSKAVAVLLKNGIY